MDIGKIGFGVYKITDEKKMQIALETAIKAGYKHIDIAAFYNNEKLVGDFLKDHKEIVVTTKIWPSDMGKNDIERAFENSLSKLGKIDILLLHWPHPEKYIEAYKYLTKLYKEKLVKKIGVSNFEISHLKEIEKISDVVPYFNQIELHPKLSQKELRKYHESKGIITEAWSPIARAKYFDDERLINLSKKYDASVSQIILAWHRQNNIYAIPKSETPSRIIENYNSININLSKEDMKIIDNMEENKRYGMHPLEFPY